MPVHLGLIAAGVAVLLLGAFDLPAAVSRLPIVKAIGEFLERIRRAGGIGLNSPQLLAICVIAGLLAGRLASGISMQLAIVSGVAAALAPLAFFWLRTAGPRASHRTRGDRPRPAALRAHLAAGENLYRSIRQLAGVAR